jgi:oxygen-independent coproporphyrinogen-3 oxidase
MDINQLFESRKEDSRWNTSYPLLPSDWAPYRAKGPLAFVEKEMAFYVHIPFCRQLCAFCEYSRMLCPDEGSQRSYLLAVARDIDSFIARHPDITLIGFDIGGGTPTALSDDNFARLAALYRSVVERLRLSPDFEPSIEATFSTLTPAKLTSIREAGIERVSLGLQSSCSNVLRQNHRRSQHLDELCRAIGNLRDGGAVRKVNLDLMYGLKGQTLESLHHDMMAIAELAPEQVTLYELRTNMTGEAVHWDKNALYRGYAYLYERLTAMGYHARFGQNTFSRDATDGGLSSYLRHRMLDGAAYKGFGLSAQSMSGEGVSYNIGKNGRDLKSLISRDTFDEEYTYRLPAAELASKYIAVGAYHGSFSLRRLSAIWGEDAAERYAPQLAFCLEQGLIAIDEEGVVSCTPAGFKYYGAVFSLFTRPDAAEAQS